MKSFFYIKRSYLQIGITLLMLFGITSATLAQGMGVIFLSDSAYAKLPRMNWNNPAIRSNVAAIASQSGTSGNRIVMLYTPPIGNQGTQGSCTGWATGYTALGILTYPDYNNWYFAERSPSYVFNQITTDCLEGAQLTDALNIIKNQGDCSINSMPYDENSCSTQPNASQIEEASQHKVFMWSALDRNDITGIKKAIDAGFPVVCGFYVYQSFKDMWNNGGTIWSSNTGNILGSHACCIIGYDDTQQMFKVQNQWGSDHGDSGFFWVSYNNVQNNNYLKEVYVVYGQMSIQGADNIFSSATYKVKNLPYNIGAKVIWSLSSTTGPLYISSTTDTSAVVTNRNWYYNVSNSLIAKIVNVQVDTLVITKTITPKYCSIGTATYSMQPCNNQSGIYNHSIYLDGTPNFIYYGCPIGISIDPGGLTLSCKLISGTPITWTFQNNNYLYVAINSPVTFKIYAGDINDVCTKTILLMPTGTYSLSASPNPASTTLNVNLAATTTATNDTTLTSLPTIASSSTATENATSAPVIISLYDLVTNNIVKQWRFQNQDLHYSLNVSGLKRGMYILRVTKGSLLLTSKVILN